MGPKSCAISTIDWSNKHTLMALTLMTYPSHIMTNHLANTCGRMLQAMISLVKYGRKEIALVLFTVGESHHHL